MGRLQLSFVIGLLSLAPAGCGDDAPLESVGTNAATVEDLDVGADGVGADAPSPPDVKPALDALPKPPEGLTQPIATPDGIVHMALHVDIGSLTATATITLARDSGGAFDVSGLTGIAVTDGGGEAVEHTVDAGTLNVVLPAGDPVVLMISYGFAALPKASFMGYMESGSTLTWPFFCGNLFPCRPHPADGFRTDLEITGVPEGLTAVYPAQIIGDVPPYTPAFAIGDYVHETIGTTKSGLDVGFWVTPASVEYVTIGTEHLVGILDWLEAHIGPYTLGGPVGPVEVDWGLFAVGGIEHHPRWHVSTPAIGNRSVHAHEAVHGWFGTGVRLQCWEDLVLSEGTSDYLAARAIEEVIGAEAGDGLWKSYANTMTLTIQAGSDSIAWPVGCNEINVLEELFSSLLYKKGAFFYRAVAKETSKAALDEVFAMFYAMHHNRAGRMQDLLDLIATETNFDPEPLANVWLRGLGLPEDFDL